MIEQGFDVRRTVRALRARRVLIAAFVAAGVAVGLVVTLAQAPTYVAHSRVLLPPTPYDSNGRPLRNMSTERHIATGGEVLDRAGKMLRPPVGPEALRRRVSALALNDDILEIRGAAATPGVAARLADAVASEYIAFSAGAAAEQVDTTVRLLQDQAAELDERVRRFDAEIADNVARLAGLDQRSPEALRQQAIVDSLRLSQSDAARQLARLETRIADARLDADLNRRGVRVLEPARPPDRPSKPRPVWNVGVSGLFGLMAGAIVALALEHRSRQVRSRDDAAEAVRAPVLASLAVPRHAGPKEYGHLLKAWAPDPVESLSLRQACTGLGIVGDEWTNLAVVAVAGDHGGLFLGVELAVFSAATGRPTAVIVASEDETASVLRAACSGANGEQGARKNLWVYDSRDDIDEEHLDQAHLTVHLVVAGDGRLVLPAWNRPTVTALAVSSGFATAEALASVAVGCLDSGCPIAGVLLANPDPTDKTTGRFDLPLALSPNGAGAAKRRWSVPALGPGPSRGV